MNNPSSTGDNGRSFQFFAFICFSAILCYFIIALESQSVRPGEIKLDETVTMAQDKENLSTVGRQHPRASLKNLSSETFLNTSDEATDSKHLSAEEIREDAYLQFIKSNGISNHSETTKKKKRLPDVIGLGVEKCGSGPLQWMMEHHPVIVGSNPMELHFFGSGKEKRGTEYYRNLMPAVTSYELASEKTPAYFNFGPSYLPIMMKTFVPNAKLIVVFCDPVNRTYSDFVHEKIMGSFKSDADYEKVMESLLKMFYKMPVTNDNAAMEFILASVEFSSHIISTGLYYYHLLRWYSSYDKNQIHIVDGEELLSDPGSVMEKVQHFLGIPRLIIKEDFVRDSSGFYCIDTPIPKFKNARFKLVKRKQPECMASHAKGRTRMGRWQHKPTEALLESLRKFYAPHNKKLYQLLGKEFGWQKPTS